MNFLVIEQNSDTILISHDEDEKGGTLDLLQTLVEGLVQYVPADRDFLGFDADVWVNEEGLFREDFCMNVLASVIVGTTIVGPAVIALSDSNGETLGLTDEQIDTLGGRMVIRRGKDDSGYNVEQLSELRAEKEEEE